MQKDQEFKGILSYMVSWATWDPVSINKQQKPSLQGFPGGFRQQWRKEVCSNLPWKVVLMRRLQGRQPREEMRESQLQTLHAILGVLAHSVTLRGPQPPAGEEGTVESMLLVLGKGPRLQWMSTCGGY